MTHEQIQLKLFKFAAKLNPTRTFQEVVAIVEETAGTWNVIGSPRADFLFDERRLSADGNKIMAIKIVRQETNLGLKEAKDMVDSGKILAYPPFPAKSMTDEQFATIRNWFAKNNYII